jgi:hypothetical protein
MERVEVLLQMAQQESDEFDKGKDQAGDRLGRHL